MSWPYYSIHFMSTLVIDFWLLNHFLFINSLLFGKLSYQFPRSVQTRCLLLCQSVWIRIDYVLSTTTARLSTTIKYFYSIIVDLYFRDVLPFTLELPEAIAKASSHKQLESISHMGVGRCNFDYQLK